MTSTSLLASCYKSNIVRNTTGASFPPPCFHFATASPHELCHLFGARQDTCYKLLLSKGSFVNWLLRKQAHIYEGSRTFARIPSHTSITSCSLPWQRQPSSDEILIKSLLSRKKLPYHQYTCSCWPLPLCAHEEHKQRGWRQESASCSPSTPDSPGASGTYVGMCGLRKRPAACAKPEQHLMRLYEGFRQREPSDATANSASLPPSHEAFPLTPPLTLIKLPLGSPQTPRESGKSFYSLC